LKAYLSGSEKEVIQKIYTSNNEALIKYVQANGYMREGHNKQDVYTALKLYQESIASDPEFVLAYAKLARCYLRIFWFKYDPSQFPLNESEKAIDEALRLDPRLPEIYIARADYFYHGFLDYESALQQLQIASEYMPNHSEINFLFAIVYRRMGKWELAIEEFENAYKSDPEHPYLLANMAETYAWMGNYKKAFEYFNKSLMIDPDNPGVCSNKFHVYLMRDGNTKKAREVVEDAALTNISMYELLEDAIYTPPFMLDVYDGDYQKALDFLSSTNWEGQIDLMHCYPKSMFQAILYELMNIPDKASTYFDSARVQLETMLSENPNDPRILGSLGITYAGLGMNETAMIYGQKAVEIFPLTVDAVRGLDRIEELAWMYVMVEEYDAALEQIEIMLSNPGLYSAPLLKLDPKWKPLWDHPEFIRLMEKYAEK